MKVLITGGSGMVGRRLLKSLILKDKYEIVLLSRNPERLQNELALPLTVQKWDGSNTIPKSVLDGVQVVFNLAGEPVAGSKWTPGVKERIMKSRGAFTEKLINQFKNYELRIPKMISASAIGFYSLTSEELLKEDSQKGEGFLADVCESWENAVLKSSSIDEAIVFRIGIVLSDKGGALAKMLPPFLLNIGGPIGDGSHHMSWIHIDDLVDMFIFAMENNLPPGAYNAVAPNPVNNKDFTKELAESLGVLAIFPVPKLALHILFGEMASVILSDQKVSNLKICSHGFVFKFTNLKQALGDIFKYLKNNEFEYTVEQWVNQDRTTTFSFFSNIYNLEKITPPFLNFKIDQMNTDKVQTGSVIDYSLRVRGIPMKWKTLIKEWKPEQYFIDEQVKGPYSKWHHTHKFTPIKNGTLVEDKVIFKLPMGKIGKLVASNFVKKDVDKIFSYRKSKIKEYFKGVPNEKI